MYCSVVRKVIWEVSGYEREGAVKAEGYHCDRKP